MNVVEALVSLAAEFSPRYERHGDDLVLIDVSGLDRLLGPARAIGEELRREAAARGIGVRVALARTQTAALVLALARPGLTIVDPDGEAEALAQLPIEILDKASAVLQPPREVERLRSRPSDSEAVPARGGGVSRAVAARGGPGGAPREVKKADSALKQWGLKTLGELAALPPADLVSRLGRPALVWQAVARGEDIRPMVPTEPEERFESSLELEWPIEGLEPLSFVLTRLLEPLSTRLERRDRGAAVLHIVLGLVTRSSILRHAPNCPDPNRGTTSSGRGEPVEPRDTYARQLQLPAPIRDVRTLRTLALLDLDAHPPPAAIDRVTVVIDPTPGRVLQHTLFTRAHPTPEQLSTLLARLGALMGQDRIGAPATVDSYRPGAFEMKPFKTEHGTRLPSREAESLRSRPSEMIASALRRCRQPVPARVALLEGRPVRVMTDRRGFAGGAVVQCAGPWRTSGDWWAGEVERAGGGAGGDLRRPVLDTREHDRASAAGPPASKKWNRDEWDVAVNDGTVYRIFCDRETDRWFVDAIVD